MLLAASPPRAEGGRRRPRSRRGRTPDWYLCNSSSPALRVRRLELFEHALLIDVRGRRGLHEAGLARLPELVVAGEAEDYLLVGQLLQGYRRRVGAVAALFRHLRAVLYDAHDLKLRGARRAARVYGDDHDLSHV